MEGKHTQKKQSSKQQPRHPLVFGVSIFADAEQFIAVYLSLVLDKSCLLQSTNYLESILKRVKSPPIALTYTYQFMSPKKSQAQIQLSIIRFISQLSDLSQGRSMQSSLSFLNSGSLLTELRHNLTHRVMVKGGLIEKSRSLVLQQLIDKYWEVYFLKIWTVYHVDHDKVAFYYENITQHSLQNISNTNSIQRQLQLHKRYIDHLFDQQNRKLQISYLVTCSNYQFKELISKYIVLKVIPFIDDQTTSSIEGFVSKSCFPEQLSGQQTKIQILFCKLVDLMLGKQSQKSQLKSCKKFYKSQVSKILKCLINIILKRKNEKQIKILKNRIVLKKWRAIYFFYYLKEFKDVAQSLPEQISTEIKQFWMKKQAKLNIQILEQDKQYQQQK